MTEDSVVDGVVKWFDLAKGFGFVVAEGVSEDILLHANIVREAGRTAVAAGDHVQVTTAQTPKGVQATQLISVTEVAPMEQSDQPMVPSVDEDILPARLKWFDKTKGYGFLNAFGQGEDIFVHVDTMRLGGMMEAAVGEAMCVVIARGAKGASATAVYPWDAARSWMDQRKQRRAD